MGAYPFILSRPGRVRPVRRVKAVLDYVLAGGNSEPLQTALKSRHIPFVVVSAYPPPLVRTEPGQENSAEAGDIGSAVRPRRGRLQARGLNLICVRLIRSVRNAAA
jgi:hypothetical protein